MNDIDTYIAGFPEDTQKLLEQIRATIRKAAPKAEEVISPFSFHLTNLYD